MVLINRIFLLICCFIFSPVSAKDALVPEAGPFTIYSFPYALKAAGIPLQQGHPFGAFIFNDAVELKSESYRFGGFSSLATAPGGRLYALSDEGGLLRTTLVTEKGRLKKLRESSFIQLWPQDAPPKRKMDYDSESMTRLKNGDFAVGFEQEHRIGFYDFRQGQPILKRTLPAPDLLREQKIPNGGMEALAELPDGSLFALTEEGRAADGNKLGYLIKNDQWQPLSLTPTGNFLPTDMTLLPNGDLLLLERSYSLFDGVAARISRIRKATLKPGALLVTEELAQFPNGSGIDNMEGIAALPQKDGSVLVLLISDDNFNPVQHTVLISLTLPKSAL